MTLLVITLKGAVVLVFAVVAGLVLRPAAARTRRLVLAAAVVGALSVPALTTLLPAWGLIPRSAGEALPLDELIAEDVLASVAAPTTAVPGEAPATATAMATASGSERASARPSISWSTLLLGLWLAGVVVVLVRLAIGLLGTFRLGRLREETEALPAAWVGSLEDALETLALGARQVRLRLNPAVEVPTVVGLFAPSILIPLEAARWGGTRRRVVLLHELAHIKHHDNLFGLLGQVLCAVHWFNPLSWWVAHRLSVESEHAADDVVLETGSRASDYAYELVHIARGSRPSMAGASAMARPAELRGRVTRILDARRRRGGWTAAQRSAFGALGLVALVALSCLGTERDDLPARLELSNGEPSPLAMAVADYYGVLPTGVELTIDGSLQGIVEDEVRSLVERYHPRSVSVVALDPCNGHVLALGTHGEGGAQVVTRAVEPGSTIKPLTIAAALEEGMSSEARFFCDNGLWTIAGGPALRDASPAGWLDVERIVVRSSNIGTGRIYQQELGWLGLQRWLSRFRFGERPTLQLADSEPGAIPEAEGSERLGLLVANGVGLRVSPIQVAAAYAALANDGVFHEPTLASRVVNGEGRVVFEHDDEGRSLVSEGTAQAVLQMLEAAVEDDEGTGRGARVNGLDIAGKTGTVQLQPLDGDEAEYYASFVGIVEPDEPQLVLLVGVEGVQGERFSGGQVAAPAFARIVSRARAMGAHVE